MTLRRTVLVCLLCVAMIGSARAQDGPAPPIGNWQGPPGAFLALFGNRTYVYRIPTAQVRGVWDWRPTSAVGGILTLHNVTPTVTQTFQNQLYLSVAWVNADTISVFGDLFHRQ